MQGSHGAVAGGASPWRLVAGDWVGPTGMLADAAIVSGSGAATWVMSDMLAPVSRSALAS